MSMNKNIARLAVTAGLTAALSFGGVMAPVTMAFAAEGATATANGSVKIANVKDNHTEFYGYQIFSHKRTGTMIDVNFVFFHQKINALAGLIDYFIFSFDHLLHIHFDGRCFYTVF